MKHSSTELLYTTTYREMHSLKRASGEAELRPLGDANGVGPRPKQHGRWRADCAQS